MSPCFHSPIIESRFLCTVVLRLSESLEDSNGLDRSRKSQCLRLTGARPTRLYGTTPMSQCNTSSTNVPATVVRIVMGMPNRA